MSYKLDGNGDEMYAPDATIENAYLPDSNGVKRYARRRDGSEIYPKLPNGVEYVLYHDDQTIQYAKDNQGNEQYPKDQFLTEFVVNNKIAKDSFGNFRYPRDDYGNPVYPVDPYTSDEIYEYKIMYGPEKGGVVLGVDRNGNECYAKFATGDEYYPETNQFAFDKVRNQYKYAFNADDDVIFKLNQAGDEIYVKKKDNSDETRNGILERYARKANGDEYYPREYVNSGNFFREIALNSEYAVDKNGVEFYPQDDFGNEYAIEDAIDIYPDGYPTTHDGFIIIAAKNGRMLLTPTHILNRETDFENVKYLERSWKEPDFLTDFEILATKRHFQRPYKTRQIDKTTPKNLKCKFKNSWVFYLLAMIVICFVIFKIA